MNDLEKAIEGLEWILADDRFGFGVKWETGEPRDDYEKAGKIITDAITLIKEQAKEQKPVEPTLKQDDDSIFVWVCGSCGAYMYHIYNGIDKAKEYAKYCRQCGRKVKWE